MPDAPRLPLPDFVTWPIFPFEGDLRVKDPLPDMAHDITREGEGDRPCRVCATDDHTYLYVDDMWRVRAMSEPKAVPVLFLETRAHLDFEDFDDELAAALGPMMLRVDRAIRAGGGVGRVHTNRWGDGASHFHLWFYARPIGSLQLMGFGMSMWAEVLPPLSRDEWDARMDAIARALTPP